MGILLLLLGTIILAGSAQAQSLDGSYAGKITCGVLTSVSRPLSVDFSMKVSGGEATYQREIVRPASGSGAAVSTGSYERGSGTVSPSGEVTLHGKGEGSFVFESEYRGQLSGITGQLSGSQRWQARGTNETRSCQVELKKLSG